MEKSCQKSNVTWIFENLKKIYDQSKNNLNLCKEVKFDVFFLETVKGLWHEIVRH